jgi:thioredoxin-related protein
MKTKIAFVAINPPWRASKRQHIFQAPLCYCATKCQDTNRHPLIRDFFKQPIPATRILLAKSKEREAEQGKKTERKSLLGAAGEIKELFSFFTRARLLPLIKCAQLKGERDFCRARLRLV